MKQKVKDLGVQKITKSALLLIAGVSVGVSTVELSHAETVPEKGQIGFKYLDYADYQPGQDRINIKAPSLMIMTPVAGEWSVTATAVSDAVSGASPRYHASQLTQLHDRRNAYTVGITRYFTHSSFTLGGSYSGERDYVSRGQSFQANFSSEDKNTTYTFGVGNSNDQILPNHAFLEEKRKKDVVDFMAGVTQVFTPVDIAQVTYRRSNGSGYFADQYKLFDVRPGSRISDSVLVRWNHHFLSLDGTLRSSYRYYTDSWKIKSHTLGFEYQQNMSHGWSLIPLVRYYSQTKADFYFGVGQKSGDVCVGAPDSIADQCNASVIYDTGANISMDQRLSAFGALTYGLKLVKQIDKDWLVDFKYEKYEQRGQWALSNGSTGLPSFGATSLQFGVRYQF